MIWQVIIVFLCAVAGYFIPTPKELQEKFTGGQNLFASANYHKAIEQYDEIIGTHSSFLEADSVKVTIMSGELTIGVIAGSYYQKANALRQLSKLDSAISIFRIVEARTDERVLSSLSQFQIYDILYMQKKFSETINEARKLVEKYPESKKAEAALYDIGWAFRETNNLVESNSAFLELLKKYPATDFYSKALYQIGQNCFELKSFDEAISYWRELGIKFKPDAFKDQDWEKVQLKAVKERQIFEATSQRETDASVLELVAKSQVKVGDCYKEKNMFDSAMSAYRKVVVTYTLLPTLVEVTYNKMADYSHKEKGIAAAEQLYRIAIDDNFANKELQAKFQYKIAEMYHNENKLIKAADEYDFYSKAYSDVASNINFSVEDAQYQKSLCLFNAEQYEQSVTSIDTFVVNFPASNYVYDLTYIKGVSLFYLKNMSEAKKTFDQVIEKKPDGMHLIPSNIYISRIELENKLESKAETILRNLLTSFPGSKYNDEINYYLIQALYETKKYDSIPAAFNSMRPGSQYFISSIIKAAKSYTLQKKYTDGELFIKGIVSKADSLKDSVNFKPEAYFAIADLQVATSKFEDAVKNLSIVVEDAKTNEMLRLQSRYLRGTLYGQINKHKESISDLENVLGNQVFLDKFKPLLANARGRLATAYTKTGQLEKGVSLMQKYVAESPDSLEKARYLVALSEVYFENKNYDKLIPCGERVIKMDVQDDFLYSRAVYLTATAYNSKNNIETALNLFSVAVQKYPEINQDVFFNFAVNLYDMQYFSNAALAFKKYVEMYPKSPSAKNAAFFTAYAHFKLGEWPLAIESFREFIKNYPEDSYAAESQYNIAESRYNAGEFAEAIKEYQQVYTKYPKSDYAAASVYNEAWSNYQLKEMEKMIVPLKKLIQDYPQSQLVPEAQFTIGDYYYNKKEYTKALYEYRTFIEKFPNHVKTEEARSFIKELSQIDAFKEYQKAIITFDKKNWKQAINELSDIVNKYPGTEVAMACEANMGSAYEQLKDIPKALEVFKSIVTKYKDDPLGSGVVYFAQQHIEWIEGNVTANK